MNIFDIRADEYEVVCEELRALLKEEKELKSRIDELKKQVCIMSGGDRMEHGIKVSVRSRLGAVDIDRMSLVLGISKTMLDSFRKPSVSYYEVRSY